MTDQRNSDIRMKDLFAHFLCRWKSILAVTVLCALVLGGWQYFSVKKAHDAGGLTKEEARYESELAVYQTNLENAQREVVFFSGVVENRIAYRDNSLLMNLDPDNVWCAEKKYLVSGIDGSAEEVLAVYTGAMVSDHDTAEVLEAFGTDNPGYAEELVSIITDPAEKSFIVKVWSSDREKAEKGLAYAAGKIREAEKTAQGVGAHTLQELTEGSSKSVYPELMEKQSAMGNQILEEEESLTRARRSLNNIMESKPFKPGNPVVRWAVTGAVLGFLLMLAIYLTTFLRKKNIR